MKLRSPIFAALAAIYEESQAGKTGRGTLAVQPTFEKLEQQVLVQTGRRLEGESYELAVAELRALDGRLLTLQWDHPRAKTTIHKVRLSLEHEAEFYAAIQRRTPTQERAAWAAIFERAASISVPVRFAPTWRAFCEMRHCAALDGSGWLPFRRNKRSQVPYQLEFTARLLGWTQPCLLRTASAKLTGDSKFFERCLGTMESLLASASGGVIRSFADLAIEHTPTEVRFHGPLCTHGAGGTVNYGSIAGLSSLTDADIANADALETTAQCCVSIENATTFHELCRLGCADLVVLSSYPNQATIAFLRRLPRELPLYHWGDTDPWGFDVLRDLRRRTGRRIAPLNMDLALRVDALPRATRARRELTARDRQRLATLIADETLRDVRAALTRMQAAGSTGDFEQEGLPPQSPAFPYLAPA